MKINRDRIIDASKEEYLNFIRKNHQFVVQEVRLRDFKSKSHQGSGLLQQKITQTIDCVDTKIPPFTITPETTSKRAIHNSLSKFVPDNYHFYSPHAALPVSLSASHSSGPVRQVNPQLFDNLISRNDLIAQQLLKKGKQQNLKKERRKVVDQVLFHLGKCKSPMILKPSDVIKKGQRYQQKQIDINLKFAIVQKPEDNIDQLRKDFKEHSQSLMERLRGISNRMIPPKPQQNTSPQKQHKQYSLPASHQTLQPPTIPLQQEMYPLLPPLRGPYLSHSTKKHKLSFVRGKMSKIQPRKYRDQQLQEGMQVKKAPISNKEIPQIFNTQKRLIQQKIEEEPKEDQPQKCDQFEIKEIIQRIEGQLALDNKQSSPVRQRKQLKPVKSYSLHQESDLSIYELKIRKYRQFLFMLLFAHHTLHPLALAQPNTFKPEHRHRYFVGGGNNGALVRSLMKRRFWWVQETDISKADFVWTQLKQMQCFQRQIKGNKYVQKIELTLEKEKKRKKGKKSSTEQAKKQKGGGIFKAPFSQTLQLKIFTQSDLHNYELLLPKLPSSLVLDRSYANCSLYLPTFSSPSPSPFMHNHFPFNHYIGNKKALFFHLQQYYSLIGKDVFDVVPLTFHICQIGDSGWQAWKIHFDKAKKAKIGANVWIVKPGEMSNRGQGITVIDELYQLTNIVKRKEKHSNGTQKTYIIQKYIEKPLLYKSRKFDIRHYLLLTRLQGTLRAYFYGQGYIRTSSSEFNLSQIDNQIMHLTNDAVQKQGQGYGKWEQGNKVSYTQISKYIQSVMGKNKGMKEVYLRMKEIAVDVVRACCVQIDPDRLNHNFQVFGLDFMLDNTLRVYLIEVNTNPCLELSSKLLSRIIPTMLEHSFRLALDPIFPPPCHYPNSQKYLAVDGSLDRLNFELIFDQGRDGKEIQRIMQGRKDIGEVEEDDEVYEDQGKQIQLIQEQNS